MMCIELEAAEHLLLKEIKGSKKSEMCLLGEAFGRVLAEDVYAPISQPPFARSPLDGYALCAKASLGAARDRPVVLKVIDEVMAGDLCKSRIGGASAIRIMTGAPVPIGADCVIRQEDTDDGETMVEIYKELSAHDNICDAGEDFREGDCLVEKGTRLDAVDLGVIAGAGIAEISVYGKVRAGLITTGDEVMEPGTALMPGKIYNSNQYFLEARLKELGAETTYKKTVGDSVADMVNAIEACAWEADLIVTTGGVSVGRKDIMHEVLGALGARRLFWKVEAKPGTPVLGAVYRDKLLICLSGNPFAAAVNLELLVRPVLARLSGNLKLAAVEKKLRMGCDFKKGSPVRRFVRAVCEDGQVMLPEGKHISGVLRSMQGCNCLVDIPAGNRGLLKGDLVCARML